jgi:hypothetical protein
MAGGMAAATEDPTTGEAAGGNGVDGSCVACVDAAESALGAMHTRTNAGVKDGQTWHTEEAPNQRWSVRPEDAQQNQPQDWCA